MLLVDRSPFRIQSVVAKDLDIFLETTVIDIIHEILAAY